MPSKQLRIVLDQHRRVWYPGQTVSGNVRLEATEQVDVDSIDIMLEGRAKSRCLHAESNNQRRTYTGKVTFFRLARILFKGPFTLKPGDMNWAFEFQIPETLDRRSCMVPVFNYSQFGQSPFNNDRQQPLPPSMSSEGTSYRDSKSCYVSYRLTANLHTSKLFSLDRDAFVGLQLLPYRTVVNPHIDYARVLRQFSIRSLHLNPDAADRSLNFKERMKTVFKNSSLPLSAFSITVEAPRSAIVGEPMQILLHLQHDLQQSTAIELPLVHLKTITLSLKNRVAIMVNAIHLLGPDDDLYSWSNVRQFIAWSGAAPIADTLDLSSVLKRPIYAPSYTPNFSTFNISYEYTFEAKFMLECGQQTQKFEAKVPFVLYSPEHNPGSGEEIISPPLQPPEEEQLPAYTPKTPPPPPTPPPNKEK